MKKFILFLIPIYVGIGILGLTEVLAAGPVAVDDLAKTRMNLSVSINLTSNDTDADWDSLTVTSILSEKNWVWVINSSWKWVIFTPKSNFTWVWSFNYAVSDWTSTDIWRVVVIISPLNSSPVALNDSLFTNKNSIEIVDTRENDIDSDSDILDISSVSNWNFWKVEFNSVSVTYIPFIDYAWSDAFTYTVDDWNWWRDTWLVNVTVNNSNISDTDFTNKIKRNEIVYAVNREFIEKYKDLKNQFEDRMSDISELDEYLTLKSQLREDYLVKLKELTEQEIPFKYQWDNIRELYANSIRSSYWNKIFQLNEEKQRLLVNRIDDKIVEISNNPTILNTTKAKYNTLLLALRDVTLSYISKKDDLFNIDSLF